MQGLWSFGLGERVQGYRIMGSMFIWCFVVGFSAFKLLALNCLVDFPELCGCGLKMWLGVPKQGVRNPQL